MYTVHVPTRGLNTCSADNFEKMHVAPHIRSSEEQNTKPNGLEEAWIILVALLLNCCNLFGSTEWTVFFECFGLVGVHYCRCNTKQQDCRIYVTNTLHRCVETDRQRQRQRQTEKETKRLRQTDKQTDKYINTFIHTYIIEIREREREIGIDIEIDMSYT